MRQDMFLIGSPGPARRWLALQYAELTQREVEYIAISRDTTESDLKQRREIVAGNALFVDQAPVRAALNGRLLIVDGIEKAERNVLPTLNNLLENREMQLEDGRFLMDPSKFGELKRHTTTQEHIVPVHEDFRVIALGVPVPPFRGRPLDPPLRSRFQSRAVIPWSPGDTWEKVITAVSQHGEGLESSHFDKNPRVGSILRASMTMRAMEEVWDSPEEEPELVRGMIHFPETTIPSSCFLAHVFQDDFPVTFLTRSYPFFGTMPVPLSHKELRKACRATIQQAGKDLMRGHEDMMRTKYKLEKIEVVDESPSTAKFHFKHQGSNAILEGSVGPFFRADRSELSTVSGRPFHAIDLHKSIVSGMAQDHCVGRDVLLTGEPGSGKSRLAEYFGEKLGYQTTLFSLYRDMSARDLLQRRTTDKQGNTGWEYSPLVSAAIRGDLLILDGLDRVDPETISVINRLVCEREAELFDGKLLRSENLEDSGDVVMIHPSFRIIALATIGSGAGVDARTSMNWLNSDALAMFSAHHLRRLRLEEQEDIIKSCFQNVPEEFLSSLLAFASALQKPRKRKAPRRTYKNRKEHQKKWKEDPTVEESLTKAESLGVRSLSLRQIIRLCAFADVFQTRALEEMRERVRSSLLGQFLPTERFNNLEMLMDNCGIPKDAEIKTSGDEDAYIDEEDDESSHLRFRNEGKFHNVVIELGQHEVRVGNVVAKLEKPEFRELVPSPKFFDIPKHRVLLEDMLEDYVSGHHLLLMGNQGVGKNKLADRMLQLVQKEREYIQLHRDSTVGSLTLSPTLRDGTIVWDDSPLVRAVTYGRALMVDEVDKAPLEVVSVLKSLIEDGELLLADGRRIVSRDRFSIAKGFGAEQEMIPLHENFRMIVLANRPGFPFLGNHVFREIGDIFSTHVISNPDKESEFELLRSYAPSVHAEVLGKLVNAFSDLRALVDQGVLNYPYSTREAVAVAKHLEHFPADGLITSLDNVLGFDIYEPDIMRVIAKTFQQNGIPLEPRNSSLKDDDDNTNKLQVILGKKETLPPPFATEEVKPPQE